MSYIALATTTLSSATGSVTFSSIPTSVNGVALRDLIVVVEGQYTSADGNAFIRFNSSSSNYSNILMFGVGSGTGGSVVVGTNSILGAGFNASGRANSIFQVFDYSQTNKHKTCLTRGNANDAVYAWAGRWASTDAVNTVAVIGAQTFASGTQISLYGVA